MKKLLLLLFIIGTTTVFAQKDFQGKAIYRFRATVKKDLFKDSKKMSEARKKQMIEMLKNRMNKTFELHFNKRESIYKEQEKLAAPGKGFGRMGSASRGITYKNTATHQMLKASDFFGKKFIITDTLKQPNWDLSSSETKKIGNYTCYKATLTKKVKKINRSFWSRNKKKETQKDTLKKKDEYREIHITAWYTPQIPVSNGPDEYWGLPGLILEINRGENVRILCTEIEINPKVTLKIEPPKKGKVITKKEFGAIAKKKMEEMQDMFKNRRKGRNRRH